MINLEKKLNWKSFYNGVPCQFLSIGQKKFTRKNPKFSFVGKMVNMRLYFRIRNNFFTRETFSAPEMSKKLWRHLMASQKLFLLEIYQNSQLTRL